MLTFTYVTIMKTNKKRNIIQQLFLAILYNAILWAKPNWRTSFYPWCSIQGHQQVSFLNERVTLHYRRTTGGLFLRC
jgi:hypothetical protein